MRSSLYISAAYELFPEFLPPVASMTVYLILLLPIELLLLFSISVALCCVHFLLLPPKCWDSFLGPLLSQDDLTPLCTWQMLGSTPELNEGPREKDRQQNKGEEPRFLRV